MNISAGDKVMYRKDGLLYEGKIKSIQGDRVEIDDNTIELIVVAVSKNTIADRISFKPDPGMKRFSHGH